MALPLIVLGVVVVLAFVAWSIRSAKSKRKAFEAALDRIGFRPCPEEREKLQATVTSLENNEGYRCEVLEPRRLARGSGVYYFVKRASRNGGAADDSPTVEEEVLFEHRRPTTKGLTLIVKPSSLQHGMATRLIGSIATAEVDSQPDDLTRLEIPPDLAGTNLIGALGPAGSRLYDLVDSSTLAVVQTLGDCGASLVRFRGGWCSVVSISRQIEFKVGELMGRLTPLL